VKLSKLTSAVRDGGFYLAADMAAVLNPTVAEKLLVDLSQGISQKVVFEEVTTSSTF